jgi:hypothetical protein
MSSTKAKKNAKTMKNNINNNNLQQHPKPPPTIKKLEKFNKIEIPTLKGTQD